MRDYMNWLHTGTGLNGWFFLYVQAVEMEPPPGSQEKSPFLFFCCCSNKFRLLFMWLFQQIQQKCEMKPALYHERL